jgi:hypothetical protein
MGRHSSHSQFAFYRSVVGWALPWFLVAAVFATGVWFAVDAIGGDSAEEPPKVASAAGSSTPEETTSSPAEGKPSRSPSARGDVEVKGNSPFEDGSGSRDEKLIIRGITIQVLNGTVSALSATDMSNELTGLGFEVVAVNESSQAYEATTVFWSSDAAREAAEALAGRFGWVAEPKPSNLTDTVSIHVVVGEDYL